MIKPIETVYNGYKFRSRLEARWAVFFDAMGIRYEYEHEGFEIEFGNGEIIRYLPDFWFPEYRLFGEVKGIDCRGQLPRDDAEKMSWMIDFNGPCANGIILLGNIPAPENAETMDWAIWKYTGKGIGYGYAIGDTPPPDAWDLDFIEYSESAPYSFKSWDDLVVTSALYKEPNRYKCACRTEKALTKARQARFEFGETPKPPTKAIVKCPLEEYVFTCEGCKHEHDQKCDFGVEIGWNGDGAVGLYPNYQQTI